MTTIIVWKNAITTNSSIRQGFSCCPLQNAGFLPHFRKHAWATNLGLLSQNGPRNTSSRASGDNKKNKEADCVSAACWTQWQRAGWSLSLWLRMTQTHDSSRPVGATIAILMKRIKDENTVDNFLEVHRYQSSRCLFTSLEQFDGPSPETLICPVPWTAPSLHLFLRRRHSDLSNDVFALTQISLQWSN